LKLKSCHIENIRSHKDTTIEFNRINIVSAINHAGKSSLQNSIQFALTGGCDVTEGAKDRKQTDLLRFNEDLGAIELLLDLDGVPVELRASLSARSGLNVTRRNPVDKNWSPVALAEDMKADKEVLACLCDNNYFIKSNPADQKKLLAAIILPSTYAWPENIKADLHNSRITPDWNSTPFSIIEFAYDKAFKLRTEVNRSIKDWRAPQDSGKYDGPPIDEVRATLNQRQNERTSVAVEKNELANAIATAEHKKANFQQKANEAQAKIVNEQKEREAIAANGVSKAMLKKLESEAAGAERAAQLESDILTRSTAIAAYRRQLEAVQTLGKTPKCPTCFQGITPDVIDEIGVPILETIAKLTEQQGADQDERRGMGDPAGAQKKLDAAKTVEQDLQRIDKRIADLERQVKSATEEAEKINPDALPRPDSLNEKLADLDGRIQRGTGFLEAANRADALKVDAEKANKAKALLDAELARLERLVVYFGPKGVKAELIAQHIGSFEQRINVALAKWGYSCSLSIEPWSFVVKRLGSRYAAQLHQLSRSEKMRFANAFCVALAVVSGWNFVILDDSETIIGDDSVALLRLVYESELDFALILMATVDERVSHKPGTCFVALDESMEEEISTTHVRLLASTPGA
jgi:DNA repair exonuclease SbcCD ATPase subunit